VDAICRVPECGKQATAGAWREPFGEYRWGVHFTITVEDTAVTWPLCAEHSRALLGAALDTVDTTLAEWGFDKRYPGPASE
jgi:hypothetical protein